MAFLRAFGCALPEQRVDNEALAQRTSRDAETILKTTGIVERRYAPAGVTVADLGVAAAKDCLARAGVDASEIGLVLFSSGSGERFFPGPAAEMAAKMGWTATPAIDLPVASAGSLIGVAMAADLAERYGNVLVVASEIMSRRISDADADTAILFGDGAGACLVSRDRGFARIADTALSTDGSYIHSLKLEQGGVLEMKGFDVIMQASRKIPRSIADLLAKNGVAVEQVQTFLMHQANLNLIRKVATTLKVPEERFFRNVERYGNTSSASLLIAGAEWWNGEALTGPLVLAAFGAGFNWGGVLAVPA